MFRFNHKIENRESIEGQKYLPSAYLPNRKESNDELEQSNLSECSSTAPSFDNNIQPTGVDRSCDIRSLVRYLVA